MEKINWSELSFGYMQLIVIFAVRIKTGLGANWEKHTDEYLTMHMAATCLHYGQEAFEGLKALREKMVKYAYFA